MKLPKIIKVGHFKFKLTEVEGLKMDGKSVWGVTDFNNYQIKLEKSMSLQNKKDTLMHEIMHTILQFIGERETLGEYMDERITESTANALRMVFLENKSLINILKP